MRKKKKSYVGYVFLGILVVLFAMFFIAASKPGKYDEFAQCLVDSGAVEYGAFWCSNCQKQKQLFGKSWKVFLNAGGYVECSTAQRTQTEICNEEGITGYPTWRFTAGEDIAGYTNLERLSQRTGCVLPS